MALDQHAANLVDTTVRAFNGDVAVVSPFDGISLIDSWTSTLRQTGQDDNPVMQGLGDLKAELQSGNPNGDTIQSILEDLADQVKVTADSAEADVKTKLTPLYQALQGFSQQLGGSSKLAAADAAAVASDATATGLNPDEQDSPMTSTVGGESTTSGVGVSSLSDDDDIASKIGGVTSITTESSTPTSGAPLSGAEAEDMDDSTGSDGGAQQASVQESDSDQMDGSLGGANENSAQETSDLAGAPDTGAASIGGMGVSGGSAESDS